RRESVTDVPNDTEVERTAIAKRSGTDIDLCDARVFRKELAVWKVRPEQQQRVAALHRTVSGREPEQPGHADIERIVVFDMLLAAQRVDDRRLQLARKLDHLVVHAGAAGSAKQRHALA